MAVAVGHAATKAEFGVYSLAFSGYVLALGAHRAITTSPFLIRFASSDLEVQRRQWPAALGAALLAALISSAVLAVSGLLAGGLLRGPFLAMACVMPGLLVQDAWRFLCFGRRRQDYAARVDLAWVLPQIALFAALFVTGSASVTMLIAAWGASAMFAALVACVVARAWPDLPQGVRFLRTHRDLVPKLFFEYAAFTGTSESMSYAVAGVAGLTAAGAIRGAQVILGFFNVVRTGIVPIVTVGAIRIYDQRPTQLTRLVNVYGGGMAALTLLYGAVFVALPSSFGTALVGKTWHEARLVLIPLTVMYLGQCVTEAVVTGFRARAAVGESLWLRIQLSSVFVTAVLVGVFLGGVQGAAWGMAVGSIIGAVQARIWWNTRSVRRDLRLQGAEGEDLDERLRGTQ